MAHIARKRFGQNFLHDAGVIDRILRSIHAKPEEAIQCYQCTLPCQSSSLCKFATR